MTQPTETDHIEEAGEWFLAVPDRGGVFDSFAQVPDQLVWPEKTFAALPELVQIWSTKWRVPVSALPAVEKLFRDLGASWPLPANP